jgi:hypothetical protein
MLDAWLSFARTGDPSCESLGSWPAFIEPGQVMRLGRTPGLQPLRREGDELWDELV